MVARKTSTVPTQIHKYGGARISSEEETQFLHDQLFAAYKYRKKLVDIENKSRAQYRALRDSKSPLLEETAKLEATLEERIKDLRKGLKKKSERDTPEQLELISEINALKAEKRKGWEASKEERKRVYMAYFAEADQAYKERYKVCTAGLGPRSKDREANIKALHEAMVGEDWPSVWKTKLQQQIDIKAELIQAREDCTCTPGTYQAVEEAFKQSKAATIGELTVKPYTGPRGKVGIQTLNLRVSDLSQESSKIYITKIGIGRGGHPLVNIRIRLSGVKKNAQYLNVTATMHKELPKDGVIKWFYIKASQVGYRLRYDVLFTLESDTFQIPQRKGLGTLAINLGWRVVKDQQVRVATTWDGQKSEVKLLEFSRNGVTRSLQESYQHQQRLLAYSDWHFDAIREYFVGWLAEQDFDIFKVQSVITAALPGHVQESWTTLAEIANGIQRWKSKKRLRKVAFALNKEFGGEDARKLWHQWVNLQKKYNRDLLYHVNSPPPAPNVDKENYALNQVRKELSQLHTWLRSKKITESAAVASLTLMWWARKEEHLTNWARDLGRRLDGQRKNTYRCWAAEWEKQYETVVIEQWDKSQTAKNPLAEDDVRTPQEENAQKMRQKVGISILTDALVSKLGRPTLITAPVNKLGRSRLITAPASGITTKHFGCGGSATKDLSTELLLCKACGKLYDQDLNAAKHLWDRAARERSGGAKKPRTARKTK